MNFRLFIVEMSVCIIWGDVFLQMSGGVCCWIGFLPYHWNHCPTLMVFLSLCRILDYIKRCLTVEATDFVLHSVIFLTVGLIANSMLKLRNKPWSMCSFTWTLHYSESITPFLTVLGDLTKASTKIRCQTDLKKKTKPNLRLANSEMSLVPFGGAREHVFAPASV